ncbi:hypothetical protein G7046_g1046 [Stylonectria norvegica]|nr:hypothetical protein G7046_g1046 [Stylonectria norvegica]
MARTRAADQHPNADRPRRNPSRASPTKTPRPVSSSRISRSRTGNNGLLLSDDDDEIEDGGNDTLASANATDTEPESEVSSDSDIDFEFTPRRTPHRTTPLSLRQRSGTRRSNRQAAGSSSRANVPSANVPPPKQTPRKVSQVQLAETSKSTPPKRQRAPSPVSQDALPEGLIPNWQSPEVPYATWTDIFYYAAISDDPDVLDTSWLLGAATVCKSFTEAALTAIYRCPPVTTSKRARRLAALLELPSASMQFNYRAKIESLYIDVQVVPQSILYQLISPLPRLKELVFFTIHDQPPYRELDRSVRWRYSDQIFQALRAETTQPGAVSAKPDDVRLKSWEWSGKLLGSVEKIEDIIIREHQTPPFANLTKLSFTNFQVPSLHKPQPKDEERELESYNEDGAVIDSVAKAIAQSKSLTHLVFEASTVVTDRLLPLLPQGLVHLSLVNCWEVTSDDFGTFLLTHGSQLRSLVLSHNQSLDLAFLTMLAEACPKLEELHVRLSYFRHHDAVSTINSDADPLYDQVLLKHQVPKWPSSIRVIDFEHIRHWTLDTAEMFLQSFVDSAATLPNLRHLGVKVMVDIPWKDRANMRHDWRKKLRKVFLRPFIPPNTSLYSQQPSAPLRKKRKSETSEPSRRSGRLATQTSDSDSRRSSKGLRGLHDRPLYKDPDTDEDEFDDEDEDEDEEAPVVNESEPQTLAEVPLYIQGLCTTVSVVFDNQKPRECQYGMEDFLDDDRSESGDEWDGDSEEDDTVFVWR